MMFSEFLDRIINDGIKAATEDYKSGHKLDGSVAGFEACRGKTPQELGELLVEANRKMREAFDNQEEEEKYWYLKCYESEVEWVVNCVSAVLVNQGGQPLTSHHPTARAVMKVAEVVGVITMN